MCVFTKEREVLYVKDGRRHNSRDVGIGYYLPDTVENRISVFLYQKLHLSADVVRGILTPYRIFIPKK